MTNRPMSHALFLYKCYKIHLNSWILISHPFVYFHRNADVLGGESFPLQVVLPWRALFCVRYTIPTFNTQAKGQETAIQNAFKDKIVIRGLLMLCVTWVYQRNIHCFDLRHAVRQYSFSSAFKLEKRVLKYYNKFRNFMTGGRLSAYHQSPLTILIIR